MRVVVGNGGDGVGFAPDMVGPTRGRRRSSVDPGTRGISILAVEQPELVPGTRQVQN
jgi:hypothetical protein